jgi:DNA helicase-2/ATP-dependent DNA helicase PcrA
MIQLTLDNLSPPPFIPSKYQEAIFDFVKCGTGHGILNAAAGAAKTTSLLKSLTYIPKTKRVIFCAFSNTIVDELKTKIPVNCRASTVHSIGYQSLMIAGYKSKIEKFKQGMIFDQIVRRDKLTVPDDYFFSVRDTVSFMKGMMLPETTESIEEILELHDIDPGYDRELFDHLVLESLKISVLQKHIVDFDDMMWIPLKLKLYIPQYDFVFIDELQDLNMSQVEITLKLCAPGGRIIAAGDENQSMYGFRGAATDAMSSTAAILNATQLPLSISYRCPISHIKLAQSYVPSIEQAPNAKEGLIKDIDGEEFLNIIQPGDMCICRNNAPLVDYAFDALDKGYKINIRGQDIGHGLQAIVKRMNARNILDLHVKLKIWRDAEILKLITEKKNPERIEDKYKALMSLSKHATDVKELLVYIKKLFSDENKEIVFSSIHRAKGLEANRIFIIKFDLIPSRWAKLDWEIQQEQNIAYVAVTRSKSELYFVD